MIETKIKTSTGERIIIARYFIDDIIYIEISGPRGGLILDLGITPDEAREIIAALEKCMEVPNAKL